jgi:UDP:flavonoid glycosyltransferase YjiC (YdhE family)
MLRARVPNEVALFEELRPAAVLTGWCLSVAISARAARIPFVNVLHSTTVREYYQAGLQSWPDRTNFAAVRWLFRNDEARMQRWMGHMILRLKLPIRPYNEVGRTYGLREFASFIDLIEGDETLLADIPEWVGFEQVRPSLHFIGPLPFRLEAAIPESVARMPKDRPVVYFAMGSSGKPKLVAELVRAWAARPYRVIAPVRGLVERAKLVPPPNVVVTDFLPAHRVNPMADISVIHGGQNTVMNACLSGTPIVGIGMHPEQQANLDACVRKGFAIRLSKRTASVRDVLGAVDALVGDADAKARVEAFAEQLGAWNGPENAARFLRERFDQPS